MGKRNNEEKIKKILCDELGPMVSFGKKKPGSAYVSVDFTYVDSNNVLYLIEIESDNKAKIDVGEYVLLNILFDEPNKKNGSKKILGDRMIKDCCFLTVVCHQKNTSERVEKVLKRVQETYSLALKHKTIKLSDIKDLESFERLIGGN